jgi:transglutaminase/protease-like cytokinesis protein 3
MLSLKATMIDLEVAARANIFFGTTQSSFSRVIASQRYEKQLRRQQQQQQPAPVYKTMRYNQLCSPTTVKCTEEKLANEIGEFCTPDDASACFYQC